MSAGLALGQTCEAAARFSILLATPITVGAGLYAMLKTAREGAVASDALLFVAGVLTSASVGWLVIRWFLAHVRRHPHARFVAYRGTKQAHKAGGHHNANQNGACEPTRP